ASTQEAQTLLLTAFVRPRVQDRAASAGRSSGRASALPPRGDGAIFVWCARSLAEGPQAGGGAPRNGGRQDGGEHHTAYPQGAGGRARTQEGAGAAAEPAEARRVHARLYDHAEEAELGPPKGRKGEADQRVRGDRLHPGRGP